MGQFTVSVGAAGALQSQSGMALEGGSGGNSLSRQSFEQS